MEERECDGGFQESALLKAARLGDVAMLAAALECSAAAIDAVGADGRTPLAVACANGHGPLVRALLDAGAEVEPFDILSAAAAAHPKLLAELTAARAKRAALWAAIQGVAPPPAAPVAGGLPPELLCLGLGGGKGASGAAESPF